MAASFFSGLTVDERAECLERGQMQARKPGDVLVAAGESFRALTVLLSGNAEVRRSGGVMLATLAPGDIIGEISFLEGPSGKATATVVATAPVDLIVLSEADLDRLIQDRPNTAARLYKALALLLARRLQATSQRLAPPQPAPPPRSPLAPKRPWPGQRST